MKRSLELSENEPESEFTLSQYLRFMQIYFISRRIKELKDLIKIATEKCKRLSSSHEYWYYCGTAEFEEGNFKESLEYFEKAKEVYEKGGSDLFVLINDVSSYYYSLYLIAHAYLRAGDKNKSKEALNYFISKVAQNPSFSDVMLNAVSLFYEMEDYENSANVCMQMLKNGTKIERIVQTYLTNIYMKSNQFDKVIQIQSQIHNPKEVKDNWYFMAKNLEDEKLFTEVESVYTEILNVLPEEINAYMGRAVSKLIQNKTVEAFSDLALAKKYSKNIDDKKRIAMLYMQIGQMTQAKALFEEVLKESSEDYETNLYYASIEQSEGKLELAEKRLSTLMDQRVDDARASVQLGNMFLANGNINKARDIFEKSIEKINDNPYLYYVLSLVYMDLDNESKALESINKAIELDPIDEGLQQIKQTIESKK